MSLSQVLAFVPVAAVIIAIPGPSVLFTIGRALSAGRRVALLTVLGNGLGLALQAVLIAVGVGALVATVAWAMTVLKVGGGVYLCWLGVQAIRHRRVSGPDSGTSISVAEVAAEAEIAETAALAKVAETAAAQESTLRSLLNGLALGATNPKSLVFLSALLPQFVQPSGTATGQMLALGLVFAALAILGDSVWAIAAARARGWFQSSPRRLEGVGAAGGATLVGLGAYTILSRSA